MIVEGEGTNCMHDSRGRGGIIVCMIEEGEGG